MDYIMIRRLLLISPPDTRPADFRVRVGICPPLGLAYLAAVLEQEGYEVKILDALVNGPQEWTEYDEGRIRWGMSDAGIRNFIRGWQPDMVGVTCPFSPREWDTLNVCRIAKDVSPKIITIVGGAHATCVPKRFMSDQNVTHVAKGEGELIFPGLIQYPMELRSTLKLSSTIPNLDAIPFPARHLLPMHRYINSDSPHSGFKQKPYTSIITSRGCPNRCTFCVIRKVWGPKIRYRSPGNVLAEIEHLVETYGIKEIHFEDDNFLADRRRAINILRGIINQKFNLSLNSPSGLAIHTLDGALLKLMRTAGYYSISLAIESGVQRTLQLMRKPVNLKEVPGLVKTIRALGMFIKAFFIIGYPGESRDDVQQTIEFAASLPLDWAIFFPATAIPGSEMEATCRKNGWLVDTDAAKLFYEPNIRTDQWGPEDVKRWKEEANERVNFLENTNVREGNYDRAIQDFEGVLRHYPDLEIAKEALKRAKEGKRNAP